VISGTIGSESISARRSRKVGEVAGLVELEAPVKVRVWLPV